MHLLAGFRTRFSRVFLPENWPLSQLGFFVIAFRQSFLTHVKTFSGSILSNNSSRDATNTSNSVTPNSVTPTRALTESPTTDIASTSFNYCDQFSRKITLVWNQQKRGFQSTRPWHDGSKKVQAVRGNGFMALPWVNDLWSPISN